MGEGTGGMTTNSEHERGASEIEHEVECLRSEIGELVDELDRRRHEAVDLRLQVRRHPRAVALLVGGIALSVIGRLVLVRRRRVQGFRTRAANLARVLVLLSKEDPSRVRRAVERRDSSPIAPLAKAAGAILPRLIRPSAAHGS